MLTATLNIHSRKQLHSILTSIPNTLENSCKMLPAYFSSELNVAVVNINKKSINALTETGLVVDLVEFEEHKLYSEERLICQFTLKQTINGKRVIIPLTITILEDFLQQIGVEILLLEHFCKLPAFQIKPNALECNIFSFQGVVKIFDLGKFNLALKCGYGGRGSYGFGLIMKEEV